MLETASFSDFKVLFFPLQLNAEKRISHRRQNFSFHKFRNRKIHNADLVLFSKMAIKIHTEKIKAALPLNYLPMSSKIKIFHLSHHNSFR